LRKDTPFFSFALLIEYANSLVLAPLKTFFLLSPLVRVPCFFPQLRKSTPLFFFFFSQCFGLRHAPFSLYSLFPLRSFLSPRNPVHLSNYRPLFPVKDLLQVLLAADKVPLFRPHFRPCLRSQELFLFFLDRDPLYGSFPWLRVGVAANLFPTLSCFERVRAGCFFSCRSRHFPGHRPP